MHCALAQLRLAQALRAAPPFLAPPGSGSSSRDLTRSAWLWEQLPQSHLCAAPADLREKAIGLTGTKISCGQGGCGACTVMLSQKNASGEIDHCSVNACLRPLLSMAGQMVTTTEGIGNDVDGFHPVQSRIAECNGTQCGFCTPGHVMAMYSLLREQPGASLSPAQIEERFDGTICRCTGYRSIMTACHSFASEGVPGEKEAIAGVAPRDWKEYDHTTEPAPPAELAESSAEGLCISTAGLEWHKPLTLAAVGEIQVSLRPPLLRRGPRAEADDDACGCRPRRGTSR